MESRLYLAPGLALDTPYTIFGYPNGNNSATGLPWAPATDGLRNITGVVNWNGTTTIYGITSTISGNGDPGADPNRLVKITDSLNAATQPAGEYFTTVRSARVLEVLRGVAFTRRAILRTSCQRRRALDEATVQSVGEPVNTFAGLFSLIGREARLWFYRLGSSVLSLVAKFARPSAG